MIRAALPPMEAARVLHADLCAGTSLVPVTPPVAGLLPEHDEWTLGVFPRSGSLHLDYARYYGMDVYYSTGPSVVVGSPQFLVGYALGTVVQRARLQRNADRLAQPQWRFFPLECAVVTNHRLWCLVDGQWVNFDYDAVTGFDLYNAALTVSFAQSDPLLISGAWALWIGVAVAHMRYGSGIAGRIPALAGL